MICNSSHTFWRYQNFCILEYLQGTMKYQVYFKNNLYNIKLKLFFFLTWTFFLWWKINLQLPLSFLVYHVNCHIFPKLVILILQFEVFLLSQTEHKCSLMLCLTQTHGFWASFGPTWRFIRPKAEEYNVLLGVDVKNPVESKLHLSSVWLISHIPCSFDSPYSSLQIFDGVGSSTLLFFIPFLLPF